MGGAHCRRCRPIWVAAAASRRRDRGFTLIELLVVLVLIGVLSTFAYSALIDAMNRARITGLTQEVSTIFQAARLEAVKRSSQVFVEAHLDTNTVISHVNVSGTDTVLAIVNLPKGVYLHGPGSMGTANLNAVYNFAVTGSVAQAQFNADGSVSKTGAFRFRDDRDNIIEVRVSPAASARIAVRKYAGDPNGSDDPTLYFESGQAGVTASGSGKGWTWN